ncbi:MULTISPECIES: DUF6069 family protein [Mumia]|uniref:DUF6069 family protein n=1 Tax=Mumia TaxID=1546255 RepID=UPI00142236DA|nr:MULTISPECIES: DUF6069 family protein [unclassified Mumia]QMW65411.1 hypothetical protein H4N58_14535 [Mumia sp. ZJ1417]
MSTVSTPRTRPTAARVPWTVDLVIVAAATVCAMIAWTFASKVAGVELTVEAGDGVQEVGVAAVAASAAAGALLGLLILRLLERLTARALPIWTALVIVGTLLSAVGPTAARSPAATGALLSLHAVVAVVVLVAAHRSRRLR